MINCCWYCVNFNQGTTDWITYYKYCFVLTIDTTYVTEFIQSKIQLKALLAIVPNLLAVLTFVSLISLKPTDLSPIIKWSNSDF